MKKAHKIYLDNAATTQLDPSVLKAMLPFLKNEFGNPSSLHEWGSRAKAAINNARAVVSKGLNAQANEIIFTSGGTESINMALFGVAREFTLRTKRTGHLIVSSIEHEAVLESARALKKEGWQISYAPVHKDGVVDVTAFKKLIKPTTMLVSIMYANNETGAIQPIAEIGSIIAGINRTRITKKQPAIIFHTDACQAGGILPIDVQKLKVDLLTLNGSKLHGPKGAGILFKRRGVQLRPIIFGGGQEFGLRSGTENTAAIVGFAKAFELCQKNMSRHIKELLTLQSYFEKRIKKEIPAIVLNGPSNEKGLLKLPGTINFSIPTVEGEALMYYLDAAGFAVATSSACTTGSTDPSHVLVAMGITPNDARSTIRISLDYTVSKVHLAQLAKVLKQTVAMLKQTKQQL